MPKYHYDIEQGSDEWFAIKSLKMSASHGTQIKSCGAGLNTYVREMILELINPKDRIETKDMERGNRLEPLARMAYEMENHVEVVEVGFVTYNKYVGVSPDGLVGDDGLVECKARNDDKHYALLIGGKNDPSAVTQCQMQLLVTGRKWCDLVSFNPNFKNHIVTNRIFPDEAVFEKLKAGFAKGEKMIKDALANPKVKEEIEKKKKKDKDDGI